MSASFQYRPRFVDIRVKPPRPGEEQEEDVLRLKPGEVPCEWPDCSRAATARAPRDRKQINSFYNFCQTHAAQYNKSWNFYAGMSEGEIRTLQAEEAMTGGRPTWQMKAGRLSREAAAFAAKFPGGQSQGTGSWQDAFGLFGREGGAPGPQPAEARPVGRIERQALLDLDLEPGVGAEAIKARYLELVKRCHPDTNGGDRGAEARLQRVIRAYKILRRSGHA